MLQGGRGTYLTGALCTLLKTTFPVTWYMKCLERCKLLQPIAVRTTCIHLDGLSVSPLDELETIGLVF